MARYFVGIQQSCDIPGLRPRVREFLPPKQKRNSRFSLVGSLEKTLDQLRILQQFVWAPIFWTRFTPAEIQCYRSETQFRHLRMVTN
jgi:hypothetical protein